MTRHEARELAFILLFEKNFTEDSVETILENAGEARSVSPDPFALRLAKGVESHTEEVDGIITRHSLKWSQKQISRVAITVMRLAVLEMCFEPDIPVSVSINEAVELTKKYGGEEEAAFVNGVLGGVARNESVVEPAEEETV